jgi:alpha-beta hydrolase superfamily lysophospholipase
MDLTTNLRAVAGQPTATADAVVQAMRQAGVGAGEPVMLAGHSQGGLTAAALAADPAVRAEFEVTHVVTAGSPIDGIDLPDTVEVLSLEHTGDVVPALDGQSARGSAHRTVVARDVGDDPRFAADVAADPLTAHGWSAYLSTAQLVDDSGDPALQAFRDSGSVFFDAPGARVETFEHYAERVDPALAVASRVDPQRST